MRRRHPSIRGAVSGFQISYKSAGKRAKVVTVKGSKKKSKVIAKLRQGRGYTVKVRAYKTLSRRRYYSPWSSAKTVKIT